MDPPPGEPDTDDVEKDNSPTRKKSRLGSVSFSQFLLSLNVCAFRQKLAVEEAEETAAVDPPNSGNTPSKVSANNLFS